jgi:hypothetical protein
VTPHEVTLARQAPPLPPAVHAPSVSPASLSADARAGRRRFPVGSITIAALPYFLIPDDDPWDRERWRRLGELP